MKLPMFSMRQSLPTSTLRSVARLMPECFRKPRLTSMFLSNAPSLTVP